MISRGLMCGKTTILRQITFRNQQLVRNLFILGLSSVAHSQLAAADKLSNLIPSISEKAPAVMSYSTNTDSVAIPVVQYAEIKELPKHPEKLLIDVREPQELQETGVIPTSINIPLGIISQVLGPGVGSEDFQQKYGRPKPGLDSYIIITCRSGKRAETAAKQAQSLGYKMVYNYQGSWIDWAEHEGLPKDPKQK